METKQVIDALFAIGPVGWSLIILTFLIALWQMKKEYNEGNFTNTVIFGFAILILASVLVTGVAVFLVKSRKQNISGHENTKIGIEQGEERR